MFAVLGGNPSKYIILWKHAQSAMRQGQPPRHVIGSHLCAGISAAIDVVKESCGNDEAGTAKLSKLFQETQVFTKSTFVANSFQLPNFDEVFSEVKQNGDSVLIPASNAIGIVLQHNLKREPFLDELEELLKTLV